MEESRKISVRIVRKFETKSTMKCLLRRIRFCSIVWVVSSKFEFVPFPIRAQIYPPEIITSHEFIVVLYLKTSTANFLCLEVIVTQLQVNLFCRKFSLPFLSSSSLCWTVITSIQQWENSRNLFNTIKKRVVSEWVSDLRFHNGK